MSARFFDINRVKPSSIASLAAIAAVLLIGSSYVAFGLLKLNPFAEHTTARMLLANSGTLGVNTPVLLTGIQVGKVTEIQKVTGGVEIQFRINAPYRIPAASEVRIENLSALGEPYLNFKPTADQAPYISDKQLLDARSAPAPTLIPDLAAKAVAVIDQLDPKAITSLVTTFDKALTGIENEVPRLERANTLLAATILSRTTLLRGLLNDLQTMGDDMSWSGPALAESGPAWKTLAASLDEVIEVSSQLYEVGDAPNDYLTGDGLIPFLHRTEKLLAELGPGMAELAPILRSMTTPIPAALAPLDISALISTALATVGADGTVRLQVTVK